MTQSGSGFFSSVAGQIFIVGVIAAVIILSPGSTSSECEFRRPTTVLRWPNASPSRKGRALAANRCAANAAHKLFRTK